MNPDYYRVLGVLDDAEDIVIKAAYRVLAQRYHPDKWQGDAAEATKRMAEINAAYAVLSDPAKRKQYDAQRGNRDFEPDPEEQETQSTGSELDENWRLACEYFPDLIGITKDLEKMSSSLALTFRLTLLETKALNDRFQVANRLENVYLQKYFGANPKIRDYAKSLILQGRKDASVELNKVVCVLGSDVDSTLIIMKIEEKYGRDLKQGKSSGRGFSSRHR